MQYEIDKIVEALSWFSNDNCVCNDNCDMCVLNNKFDFENDSICEVLVRVNSKIQEELK